MQYGPHLDVQLLFQILSFRCTAEHDDTSFLIIQRYIWSVSHKLCACIHCPIREQLTSTCM